MILGVPFSFIPTLIRWSSPRPLAFFVLISWCSMGNLKVVHKCERVWGLGTADASHLWLFTKVTDSSEIVHLQQYIYINMCVLLQGWWRLKKYWINYCINERFDVQSSFLEKYLFYLWYKKKKKHKNSSMTCSQSQKM